MEINLQSFFVLPLPLHRRYDYLTQHSAVQIYIQNSSVNFVLLRFVLLSFVLMMVTDTNYIRGSKGLFTTILFILEINLLPVLWIQSYHKHTFLT